MSWIGVVYLGALALLAVYGLHRAQLVLVHLYHRWRAQRGAGVTQLELPAVTVQIPLYNERHVAARAIDAAGALDWPADRLEIQILDDSDDDTAEICAERVAYLRGRGLDVKHIRRGERAGYKAGALAHGLRSARGELLLILDADFAPRPDVLARAVRPFADPAVAMVQLRWGHLNRDHSLLTETQALLLDGHFVIEHGARAAAGRFFNFSGTAGVWRKTAIADAGGWQTDTLTEDMDLSYRAQLRGWRFVYLGDSTVSAELPVEMSAFKSQQFRWAKGQMQVARKLLPAVLAADIPAPVKLEAFFHLTQNLAYPLLLLVCLLALPNLLLDGSGGAPAVVHGPLFAGACLPLAAFYAVSQRGGAWRALARLPCIMALCAGLTISQTRAVVEALLGRTSPFVRTPKRGLVGRGDQLAMPAYPVERSLGAILEIGLEIGLAVYCAAAAILAARLDGSWSLLTLPFLVVFAAGFAWVGVQSLRRGRQQC